MDTKFIKAIQDAGWQIVHVERDSAVMGCSREGCGLKSRIKAGAVVPMAAKKVPALAEIAINGFDDARMFLRQRREDLALSMENVELVAGIAVTYINKFEKDDPSKIPNIETFVDWVAALGYQVVLRPTDLPPYTMRIISETRTELGKRVKRTRYYQAQREGRRATALKLPQE